MSLHLLTTTTKKTKEAKHTSVSANLRQSLGSLLAAGVLGSQNPSSRLKLVLGVTPSDRTWSLRHITLLAVFRDKSLPTCPPLFL